jgi:hypothetical protein
MVLDAVRPHAAQVWLFGSRARGDAVSTSDIDVALDPVRGPLPREVLSRLRERLHESPVPWTVDVVDLSTVDADFRRRVLLEGVRWND